MKKLQFALSLTALLALLVTGVCAADAMPKNMTLVAQNEFLALYMDPATTEIAVMELASGRVWFSNPQNWNKLETQARGTAKEQLGAQLLITYDRSDRRNREMNNYTDSIKHGLFEILPIEDGVRVEYTLGRKWQDADWLPVVIRKTHLEERILSQIPKEDWEDFISRYHLVYLREPTGIAPLQLQGMNMDSLLNGYEFVVVTDQANALTEQILSLREDLASAAGAEREKILSEVNRLEAQLNGIKTKVAWEILEVIANNRADVENMTEVKFEHLKHLVDTPTYYMGRVPVFARTGLIEAVKNTDYTPEEASEERVANNLDPLQPNLETFFVPIEYRLDRDSLVVRVPMDEVVYPLEVKDNSGQTYTYPLHTVTVLPYFGAAYKDKDGYIFMPDGSGALINFNSSKFTLSYLGGLVYGVDLTADNRSQQLVMTEQTYMPVYGMKTDDTAFLAIIENGEAFARINAVKAGFVNSFNFVSPQFDVMPRASLSLGPIGSVVVYQKRIYQGDIQIRFKFLTGENADYVGMAKSYRDYLIQNGSLSRPQADEELPLYVSMVGSILRNEPVVGIPREVVRSLTTFDQALAIVDQLLQSGIRNIKMRYSGWLSGGPKHIFPDRVEVERAVGGEEGLRDLATSLKEKGVDFYPEVNFLNVFRNSSFDSFVSRRDAAQYFDNRPKQITEYDIAFGLPENSGKYILAPNSLGRVVRLFFEDYSRYGIAGIALQCLGNQVNSDFRNKPERVVDRQQSVSIIKEQLAWIKQAGYDILVEGGNALAYPYVDSIVGVPFRSSNHEIIDETVPFYQIVLSGCIHYAGGPLNMSSDYRRLLLQSIGVGAGLHFLWAYGDTHLLTNTEYDYLYSVRYSDWIDQAIRDYRKANEIYSRIRGAVIEDYQRLDSDKWMTVFDNGCRLTVDYASCTVTVHEKTGELTVYQF